MYSSTTLAAYASPTGVITRGGQVTDILPSANGTRLELDGRHSDLACNFVLIQEPDQMGQQVAEQALAGKSSGLFEIRIPGENNRVYFADTAEEGLALLQLKIGVEPQYREYMTTFFNLMRVVSKGAAESVVTGCFGKPVAEAFVALSQPRPAPRFALGQQAVLNGCNTLLQVVGIQLGPIFKLRESDAGTGWAYYFAGESGISNPIAELLLSAPVAGKYYKTTP